MNSWLALDCSNYNNINQEILHWINSNLDTSIDIPFWNPINASSLINSCPLFKSWLIDQKLYIKAIAVTYGTHVDCCHAHIDTPPARFKLSWPVQNTTGSWNRWFKETGTPESFINQYGGKVYKNYNNLEEIACKELLAPCIIDAGIPHDVWYKDRTHAKFPRIGLQCHLFKEPNEL